MSAQNGGPAFPSDGKWGNGFDEPGMWLRDYFAAKAMQIAAQAETQAPTRGGEVTGGPTYRGIAERAYLMADAMLAAREVTP